MAFSAYYRTSSNTPYYYCHICNSRKGNNEIIPTESGDLKCMSCQQTGFVEKVNGGSTDRPSTFHAQQGGQSGESGQRRGLDEENMPDPFASVFGVPLNTFFQNVFSGSFGFPMMSTDPNVPMNVRFEEDFQNYFGQTFSSFFGTEGARNQQRQFGPRGRNISFTRLFNSLVANPMDQQAMNQILHFVMENDPNSYGSPPAAKKVVEALKVVELTKEKAKEYETCTICTEDFKEGDKIHLLTEEKEKCGHAFHVDCIIPWLKQHNSCPVCRFELPTDDDNYNRQRDYLMSRIVEEVRRNAGPQANQPTNNETNT
ncbi:RING-type E3 ubiquitin transferase [Theileria orientalis]|uniref:RING-type E3 ubiquitin transferase n=1 Tax=Theileria orientalis TaxID=68886 RepID=A0A976MD17_THEOR|nr:RING-type E3 ubiquitin transferase [Theileria orientalis]